MSRFDDLIAKRMSAAPSSASAQESRHARAAARFNRRMEATMGRHRARSRFADAIARLNSLPPRPSAGARFAVWHRRREKLARVGKDDGTTAAEVTVEVTKVAAPDERFVIGWASVTSVDGVPVQDRQGDVLDDHELEAAAAAFMRGHAVGLAMHAGEPEIDFTTSLVLTPAIKAALGITVEGNKCGWIVGGHVRSDAVWKRVKSGELRSLSIGGRATREPIT